MATLLVACASLAPLGCWRQRNITLPPGFTGTKVLEGTLGGPLEARVWGPGCSGFVASEPNHEVLSEASLPYVRVTVNGGGVDTTLALQLPDGTYRCNDDAEGHDPRVELRLPAGLTRVWVGGYGAGATGRYRLGVSTDRSVTAASLGAPEQR
ncbi:MAG: hypothetical protein KC593_20535 [Myxococcales bacterium]|nr:hypothetical protein [Myxococcales bacterium]MCB9625919.1 hypothetical protein [Sandaracinaceae bacterium]